LASAALVCAPAIASAQINYEVVYQFADANAEMYGPLVRANDGNYYTTTTFAGPGLCGSVFRMAPDGSVTVLHTFIGGDMDGCEPLAGLVQASDGNLYGTTAYGGPADKGTVFRVTLDGTVTVMQAFSGNPEGWFPNAPLIQATDGNLYGTTMVGGSSGAGSIFRMTLGGSLSVLYSFKGDLDGAEPIAGLVQGADGNFYGTTNRGGSVTPSGGGGTAFRMTPGGTVTILHAFNGTSDGSDLRAGLLEVDGRLYGTAASNGSAIHKCGTIFSVTPAGDFAVLHTFLGSNDGCNPSAPLILASDDTFYGTTAGANDVGGYGTVFEMTRDGALTAGLHAMSGSDGSEPNTPLLQGADGKLYGTALSGTIFRLGLALPDLKVATLTVPARSGAGQTIAIHDNITNQGFGAATSSVTRLYLSTDSVLDSSDVLIGDRTVRALQVGASNAGATTALIPTATPPGVYYVIAEADGPGVVTETNEANNTLAKKITIGPDLTVSVLTAPSSASAGAAISIADTTKNTGGVSDGVATITRFYLSKNTAIDPSDFTLGSRTVPALAPSAASASSTSVTIPAGTAPGAYHIIAVSDATSVVAESNEGNNKKVIAITVNP
jgi:uncharacterized repeat protein (TIGR03803 family)